MKNKMKRLLSALLMLALLVSGVPVGAEEAVPAELTAVESPAPEESTPEIIAEEPAAEAEAAVVEAAEEAAPESSAEAGQEIIESQPAESETAVQAAGRILLNTDEITLGLEESFMLSASTDTGAGEFSFESSKPKYAAVDADGRITGKRVGSAVITVRCGELSAECAVTIKNAPSVVTLSAKKLSLGLGETAPLTADFGKDTAGAYSWSCDNDCVKLGVGTVTAVKEGTAKVTVTTYNGKSASCTVTVLPEPGAILLDETEISLPMGVSHQLEPRVDKGSAAFIYASSDEGVAAVDADGKITGVSEGTALITISTFNGLRAECAVTVTPAPTVITLNADAVVLGVGEEFRIVPTANYGEGGYTYASSAKKIATVSKDGVVTAKKAGSATITVTAFNGLTAECEVTVKRAPSSITLAKKKLSISVGQSAKIEASVNSGSAGALSYASNSDIITVDESGVVTAHAAGTAKVTVSSYNGRKATCTITVVPVPTYIKLNSGHFELPMATTAQLKPEVDPGSSANFSYFSSDESIATVDESGLITAVSVGSAVITACTHNGLSAECTVNVTLAPTKIELNVKKVTLGVGEKLQLAAEADQGGDAGLSYKSKNERTATVSKAGLITAKKAGTTVITVSTFNGVTAECEVTVKRAPSSIKINEKNLLLTVGQSANLTYTLSSSSAGAVSFSSDSECVKVSADGMVTAVSAGAAKITAVTFNGKKASCTINVISNDYAVHGLSVTGKTITATVSTVKAAKLYVEVLSEDGKKLLSSVTGDAGADLKLAEVDVVSKKALPKFFMLRAQIQDAKGNPLSAAYTTKRYTQAYQDFENQKPEDFPEEKVLDFGKAGYGVLVDNIVHISGDVQHSGEEFTFTTDASLKPGSVLLIDGEPVKVKTAEQNPDGTTTITRDTNTYLADFYQVLNLEANIMMGSGDVAAIDEDPEIDYDESFALPGFDESKTWGPVTLHGDFTNNLVVRAIYDVVNFGRDYFEVEVSLEGTGTATFTISGEYTKDFNLELYNQQVPIGATGLFVDLGFNLPVSFHAEATGTATATFNYKMGFKYDPKNGRTDFMDKGADAVAKIEGSFTIDAGVAVTIGVSAVEMIGVDITGTVGATIGGVLENMTTDSVATAGNSYHACKGCVKISVDAYFKLEGSLNYTITEKLTGTIASLELDPINWHVLDAYFSFINERDSVHRGKAKFDLGTCPNHRYRVQIDTVNWEEIDVYGIPLTVKRTDLENAPAIPGGESTYVVYLYPGSYTATATFESGPSDKGFIVTTSDIYPYVEEKGVMVSGTVRENNEENPGSGKAIPGASVKITHAKSGKTWSATTDSKGAYKIEKPMPAGEFNFEFSASGYESSGYSVSYTPGTNNTANASLKKLEGVPFITASLNTSGTVRLATLDGKTDGIPKVTLTVKVDNWGEIDKITLNYEGSTYTLSPSGRIYSVTANGFNMGNDQYSFTISAGINGTAGGTEAVLLQAKNGKLSLAKKFLWGDRTDDIWVDGKFTSKNKYSLTIYPTKTKFNGMMTDKADRKGQKLWENGTGYLTPELQEDGYYDVIFKTSERCMYNADYIGSSHTRYSMEKGTIKITEQWYDGPRGTLPTLSASLDEIGSAQLKAEDGSSDIPKVTMSTAKGEFMGIGSVTLKHEDAKKNWVLSGLDYCPKVDLTALDMGDGEYTYVLHAWYGSTGGGAYVVVLRVKDGAWSVLKDFGKDREIYLEGKFSDGRRYSGIMYPSGKAFSGMQDFDWDMRKGKSLTCLDGYTEFQKNENDGYDIVYQHSIRGETLIDFVGSLNTRFVMKDGKFQMAEQWFEPSYEPLQPITAEVTPGNSAVLKSVGSAKDSPATITAHSRGSRISSISVYHGDTSAIFEYMPNNAYRAKIFAVDAGSGSYTYVLQFFGRNEDSSDEIVIFDLKSGVWRNLFNTVDNTPISISGSFIDEENFSGKLLPSKTSFTGKVAANPYLTRTGQNLTFAVKGSATYEQDADEPEKYSIVLRNSICGVNASDVIGAYCCTRYVMKNGALSRSNQWFEMEN